jgi:hypothetical protein
MQLNAYNFNKSVMGEIPNKLPNFVPTVTFYTPVHLRLGYINIVGKVQSASQMVIFHICASQ